MAGLRRLLEEDLKLDKFTLDPFKKFISQQLDEVRFKSVQKVSLLHIRSRHDAQQISVECEGIIVF